MSEKTKFKVHKNPTPEVIMEMMANNFARYAKHMAFGTLMDMEEFGERSEGLDFLKDAVMGLYDELESLRVFGEEMDKTLKLADAAIAATDAEKH